MQRLEQKVSALEMEKAQLKQKLSAVEAKRTLAEFKNKILMEMVGRLCSVGTLLSTEPDQLACTELDAEKNHEQCQRESLKAEALKWKLSETLMTK